MSFWRQLLVSVKVEVLLGDLPRELTPELKATSNLADGRDGGAEIAGLFGAA